MVLLSELDRISGTTREPFSVPDYYDLRGRTHGFAALAGFASRPYSLAGDGSEPEQVVATAVSADYFGLLGVEPLRGRVFAAAEDAPGGPRVALLGEGLWRRRFAADPGVVGRTVQLDGEPYVDGSYLMDMQVRARARSGVVERRLGSSRVGRGAMPAVRRATATESGVGVHHVKRDFSRAERPVDSDRVSCHPGDERARARRIACSAATAAV